MSTEIKESKKTRFIYLDNVKLLFAILVIFNHVRVTYEGSGWWYYIEENYLDLFSTIVFQTLASLGGLFQAALLGLFFLLAGFLTPKSFDRKGISSFWKERLLRLGIPIMLYLLLINSIIFYLLAMLGIQPWNTYPNLQGSFLDYYLSNFQSLEKVKNPCCYIPRFYSHTTISCYKINSCFYSSSHLLLFGKSLWT